jgi:hypothetical protein
MHLCTNRALQHGLKVHSRHLASFTRQASRTRHSPCSMASAGLSTSNWPDSKPPVASSARPWPAVRCQLHNSARPDAQLHTMAVTHSADAPTFHSPYFNWAHKSLRLEVRVRVDLVSRLLAVRGQATGRIGTNSSVAVVVGFDGCQLCTAWRRWRSAKASATPPVPHRTAGSPPRCAATSTRCIAAHRMLAWVGIVRATYSRQLRQ